MDTNTTFVSMMARGICNDTTAAVDDSLSIVAFYIFLYIFTSIKMPTVDDSFSVGIFFILKGGMT